MRRLLVLALLLCLPAISDSEGVNYYTVPGGTQIIYNVQPDTTTTGTSEECLWTGSVSIGIGELVDFWAFSQHAANTNSASQTVRVGQGTCTGSTSMSAALGTTSGGWHNHQLRCVRVSSSVLICNRKYFAAGSGAAEIGPDTNFFITSLNFALPVTFNVTGTTGTQAGDITLRVVRMVRYR